MHSNGYDNAATLTLSLVPESFTLHGKACSFGAPLHAESLQRLVGKQSFCLKDLLLRRCLATLSPATVIRNCEWLFIQPDNLLQGKKPIKVSDHSISRNLDNQKKIFQYIKIN